MTHSLSCKICGGAAPFFDSADLHANASMHYGFYDRPLLPSGVRLDYFRCASCGFFFTPFMDSWDDETFRTRIYNKDYAQIDGTYHGYRAGMFANIFTLGLHDYLPQLDLLDYGGGFGLQALMLKAFGARTSLSYDPHAIQKNRPTGRFHMVSCIEVLEHATDPKALFADLVSFIDPDTGLIFITTEVQPDTIEQQKCGWWYCSPRVGHVSLFSFEALRRLIAPYGFKMVSIGRQSHIAYRRWPVWAEKLLPAEARQGMQTA